MNSRNPIHLFAKPGLGRIEREIPVDGRGRVFFKGTYWPARYYANPNLLTAKAQSAVSVIGRQGITLLIMPTITHQQA